MSAVIYDKTPKGREEIATRKFQLAPRMRSLLVMVDGKQNKSDLLKKIIGLGLNEQNIFDLLEQEFIVVVSNNVAVAGPTESEIHAVPADDIAQKSVSDADSLSKEDDAARRFREVYNFFNETIKSNLGLRGFNLQLKVERAANIQDFFELRRPYIEAILNAKGKEMAISLRDRLDQLLNPGLSIVSDKVIADALS